MSTHIIGVYACHLKGNGKRKYAQSIIIIIRIQTTTSIFNQLATDNQ